ncbi:Imm1 family immunity protein [Streptomyces sp. NPDC051771]|uniref:Imm1 family immunity protein n=1 Tax=Streptomyces sp. NPDC051771 TaxID=3154847 RepID=UPI003436CCE7
MVYARSDEEIRELVDHVMRDLIQGGISSDGFEQMPEYATICIVDDQYPEETNQQWPSNYLHVTVNTGNGYGALRWLTTNSPAGADEDHMSHFVWISKNPTPPDFDPRLILDPSTPLYFPAESALPAEKVRAALVEFCRVRTGERPTSIEWMIDPFSLDD